MLPEIGGGWAAIILDDSNQSSISGNEVIQLIIGWN